MADQTTTHFETMGTSAAYAQVVSDPSPNLKFRPKYGPSADETVIGTKGNRQGVQERLGAQYAPQVTIVQPNEPEASQTQRNVRLVPSSVGNRDFWLKRQYGQTSDFG